MGYIWGLNNKKSSGGNNAQVETNKNNIDALTTRVNSLANTTAKTNIANTFTTNQNFNGHINVLLDNMIQLGYGANDIKLILQSVSGTSNAKVKANKGDLILEAATGRIDLQNQAKLANVANIKSVTKQNVANGTNVTHQLPANSIVLMVRRNSNGANVTNWQLLNSGALTITNDTGQTDNFIITYWEM